VQATTSGISEENKASTATYPRRRFSPAERQTILQRYHVSGLKQAEFIAGEGISKATLGKWLQREQQPAKAKPPPPQFQEVVWPPSRSSWQVEIVSPQNWILRFAAAPAASALEPLLRALPC
jgi:transposase-like protein